MNEQNQEIRIREDEELEIDLFELVQYIRARWVTLVIALVAGVLIAGLITHFLITPKYKATTKLYMVSASNDSVIDLTDLNVGTSLSMDYVEMIKIRPIFEDVIEEEQLSYTYEELLAMTSVENITDTRILTITVESANPKESMLVANALAKKAVTYLPKLMDTSTPNIAEEAIYPKLQSYPSLAKNCLIGGVGLVAVVIVIFAFLYVTDDTLKNDEDVEKLFGVMPLTVIPEGDLEEDKADTEQTEKDKGGKS